MYFKILTLNLLYFRQSSSAVGNCQGNDLKDSPYQGDCQEISPRYAEFQEAGNKMNLTFVDLQDNFYESDLAWAELELCGAPKPLS